MISDRFPLVKLGEVVEMHSGYQLRESVESDPTGDIKFVQVRDLNRETHTVDLSGVDTIKFDRDFDVSKYRIKDGDVLFLAKGSKPGAFRVVGFDGLDDSQFTPVPMSHFLVVRTDATRLLPSFLVWVLNQRFFEPQIKRSMAGSGIPFIPKNSFLEYEIPLPPLSLQKKISEIYQARSHEKELVRRREELTDKLIEHKLGQILS